jgi:hypothetical protein
VPTPGLYPVKILYFQRKGTWVLEVLWTPPGGARAAIAGDALVHLRR